MFIGHPDEPAHTTPRRGSRVLVSPVVSAAINAMGRGYDVLTLGYDRMIRLGRMDVRLVPAGLGPGSAQIEISLRGRKILFTSGIRLAQPIASQPSVEIPQCDVLLIDATPSTQRPLSPRRVSRQLREWVLTTSATHQTAVLCAGSRAAAIDIAWLLRDIDIEVRAHRSFFEMLRRIGKLGYTLPRLRRLEGVWPTSGIVLHRFERWPGSRLAASGRAPVAVVGPGIERPPWADAVFRIGEVEDRSGWVAYAKQTGARQVALGPGCDDAMAQRLSKSGVAVYRVPPSWQMQLPL